MCLPLIMTGFHPQVKTTELLFIRWKGGSFPLDRLWFLLLVCTDHLPCHSTDKASTRMFFSRSSMLMTRARAKLTGEGGDGWVWCDRRREVGATLLRLSYQTPLTWLWTWGPGDQMIASPIRAKYLRAISITWPYHTPITQNSTCLLWPAMPKET